MQLLAPAKINLSFRILGRRGDGFHEIETLMAPISLSDRLTYRRAEDGSGVTLRCDDPALPTGRENLVVRAAELLLQTAGAENRGVEIELEKHIPHGAGLGGGSSDAATTLLGLNELLDLGVPRSRLLELAAELGSDVPFFLLQSAATGRGKGEIVSPEKMSPQFSLLLLKPEFPVPTPAAYARWAASRELPDFRYAAQTVSGIEFCNDLERPVFEKYVFLGHLKNWLLAQPEVEGALLSGSGSTVFSVLKAGADGEALGERARAELDPKLWSCVASTNGGAR